MEEYYDLAKELEMGTRRKKKTEEIIIENKLEKRWWNILAEGLRMEEIHTGWEKMWWFIF
ncbi:unnamed protein product [Brassica napus]|uniref:(rape) hypothetical protein n=1 Tax=Brassica napus TaxID=3708 RepID=A0A817A422_BRANA|nr:unnamed protein product [Brassica napus]